MTDSPTTPTPATPDPDEVCDAVCTDRWCRLNPCARTGQPAPQGTR